MSYMQAIALVCSETANFTLERVQVPEPGPREVLVRMAYSGVSIGTEFALIRKKISWGAFPLVTGYMGTGIVEEVGGEVDDYQAGDRVYVRMNKAITLADGTSASPVSGVHCSHVVTETGGTHGLGRLPEGVDMEMASAYVMPAVGYHGVNMSGARLGETVVVFGCGLIGLGVVASASLRGCRVIAVDLQKRQLELAQALGADTVLLASEEGLKLRIDSLTNGGADLVFECTGVPALLDLAVSLCRTRGTFVWQGNYGEQPISFSFLPAHARQLTTYFPCEDGYHPCRRAVLKHMAAGILPWDKTFTHRIPCSEAPECFARILGGDKDITGVTIRWV